MTGSKYVLKGLSLYSGLDEETLELRQAYVDTIRAGGYTGDLVVADDLHTTTLG
jgi:hypothetical protein